MLRKFLDIFCSAYMDNVLIWTDRDYSDHMEKVGLVLGKLKAAGLNLDLSKCEFAVKETKYLGFIVTAGEGIKVDPAKVKAIKEWEAPINATGVRSFLGFANFYRDFIDNFSKLADPLTKLTCKSAAFVWGKDEEKSFQQLKELFMLAPILVRWDPDRDTVLKCDCSGYALGGTLS
jgi:hypothetical protein